MRERFPLLLLVGLALLPAACGPKGPPAPDIDGLIAKLKSADPQERGMAGSALRDAGEPAVPALTATLADTSIDPTVRAAAASVLWAMGPKAGSAVPALAAALEDSEDTVRESAAMALETIGPEARAAVPALAKAVRDRAPAVRVRAVKTLGQLGPEAQAAVPALRSVLKDEALREAAEDALRKISGR